MRLWHCKSRITVLGEKWSETDDTFSWLCKRIFNSRCRIRIKWEKPPFFHHCGLTACFTASRQCCLSSPCLDHRAASHSRGEGAPPLARGFTLSPHHFPPRKRGNKTRRLIRWGWSTWGFPHLWDFPLSQSAGRMPAPQPARPIPSPGVAEAEVRQDSRRHLEAHGDAACSGWPLSAFANIWTIPSF